MAYKKKKKLDKGQYLIISYPIYFLLGPIYFYRLHLFLNT